MKKISQRDIDYILDNIDIVELVSEYVNLEKRGQNYKGLCPFHNEKTPSFTVSPEKQIAHCFGCGNGGNIFQFLSKIENITYNNAIVKLGKRLGLDLEDTTTEKDVYDLNNEFDLMYYANSLIADYYNYILLNTKEAEQALNYLLKRGINKDTIKHFKIGYAPEGNYAVKFFESKNISLEIAKRAGIIGESVEALNYYDIFKNRIIYPIKDFKNRVVAFSGRTLSNNSDVAKYYNTHETEIFEKRTVLYNYSEARQFILKEKQIIICEGYMDVISAYQAGVKNIVALMGTNIDQSSINEIFRLTNKIVLALDNDSAGTKSILEIGNKLVNQTNNLYKLSFYNAKDLDEFILSKKNSSEYFNLHEYVYNNRKHFIEFKIDYLFEKSINDIENKINYKNEILENISTIADESLKDILITYLSDKFNIQKNILNTELAKYGKNKLEYKEYNYSKNSLESFYNKMTYDKKICTLFKYFFEDRDIFLKYYAELDNYIFYDDIFRKLFESIIIYYNNYNVFEVNKFINNINDLELVNLVNYILENESLIIDIKNGNHIVNDYINYLKINSEINSNLNKIKEKLKQAISEESYDRQKEILKKLTKYKK